MPSEQIKLSHKFPQNPNLAYLLFFDRLSSKCERRRGINLCHYLRARYDHARTRTHFPALTAYNTQNLWRTMENKFLWSWQISLEYSKAFMPPDMIMQVFCKRYLLSALRFFCGQICTSTLLAHKNSTTLLPSFWFMGAHFLKLSKFVFYIVSTLSP